MKVLERRIQELQAAFEEAQKQYEADKLARKDSSDEESDYEGPAAFQRKRKRNGRENARKLILMSAGRGLTKDQDEAKKTLRVRIESLFSALVVAKFRNLQKKVYDAIDRLISDADNVGDGAPLDETYSLDYSKDTTDEPNKKFIKRVTEIVSGNFIVRTKLFISFSKPHFRNTLG